MKIPDLAAFCVQTVDGSTEKCITFPGGAKICIPDPHLGHPLTQVMELLKLVNAALMPLQPFFDVLNVIIAIKECIEAVPGLLTDPTKLVDAITKLLKAFAKLVKLFPQVSIPIMVKDILVVIAFFLRAIATELDAFVSQTARIAESETLAAELGLDALTAEVSCAQGNMAAEMGNLNAGLGPLANILGLVNLLLKLIGAPEISVDLSSSDDPASAIEAMLAIANVIDQAASAIPI